MMSAHIGTDFKSETGLSKRFRHKVYTSSYTISSSFHTDLFNKDETRYIIIICKCPQFSEVRPGIAKYGFCVISIHANK